MTFRFSFLTNCFILAHEDLIELANILHRDISIYNLMLRHDFAKLSHLQLACRQGLLIDLDHACDVDEDGDELDLYENDPRHPSLIPSEECGNSYYWMVHNARAHSNQKRTQTARTARALKATYKELEKSSSNLDNSIWDMPSTTPNSSLTGTATVHIGDLTDKEKEVTGMVRNRQTVCPIYLRYHM